METTKLDYEIVDGDEILFKGSHAVGDFGVKNVNELSRNEIMQMARVVGMDNLMFGNLTFRAYHLDADGRIVDEDNYSTNKLVDGIWLS